MGRKGNAMLKGKLIFYGLAVITILMMSTCEMESSFTDLIQGKIETDLGTSDDGEDTELVVTITAIPGVVVPVRGDVPATVITETDEYTGTVTWSPADNPFAAVTVYTGTITLTAKTGYTFTDVTENFFTVAGATMVTNAVDSGIVTAVFPATGAEDDIDVVFQSTEQIGGSSGTADSTSLILTFSADPTTLNAENITVTGATKGALSGAGTMRSLGISNITVSNGETVSVAITSPPGYSVSGSPKTAVVYKWAYIGKSYQGGKIAYILEAGDPGYIADETHGLIAATADQSAGIVWAIPEYQVTWVDTETELGTGLSNTNNIITQNGTGVTYAAGLARAYDGGGYTDWYLPSKDELNKLYINRVAIGGFESENYWSSTGSGSNLAWYQRFSNAFQNGTDKSYSARVRAIRSF
jgi:hypothetical protein